MRQEDKLQTPHQGARRGIPVRRIGAIAGVVAVSAFAAGCGREASSNNASDDAAKSKLSGLVEVDGSSTVGPLVTFAAEQFGKVNPKVQVTVGISGTGGGFERFCAGETDISNASRPIKPEETQACKSKNVNFRELQVANDGIAVVVNNDNTWAKCLTVAQLNKIWAPNSKITNWNQVDPSFPSQKMTLFGAGTDSGTFDFFTEAVNGDAGKSRTDYQATEDDNVTVQGVSGEKGGLGYFGLSYYEENQDKLKDVAVNGGKGCVTPTSATVQNGSYQPLSRPLYIYVNADSFKQTEVQQFVRYMVFNPKAVAEGSQFVPMTTTQAKAAQAAYVKDLRQAKATGT